MDLSRFIGDRKFLDLVLALVAVVIICPETGWAQSAVAFVRDPSSQILTDMARYGYSETTVDLEVKVLGGEVSFRRSLVAGSWEFNRRWNPALAKASCRGAVIERGVYKYYYRGTETVSYQGEDHEADIYGYQTDKRFVAIQDPDQPVPVTIQVASGSSGGGGSGIGVCSDRPIKYLSLRWEDRYGNWIEFDGDNGRLLKYGDRNNVTVSFSYDANGNRAGVFDHFGSQVLFYTYQAIGEQTRLTSVSDSTSRGVGYVWSADGRTLDQVIDVRGNQWIYSYVNGNQLEKVTDPEGRQKLVTLNSAGGVESVMMAESGETTGVGKSHIYSYNPTSKEFAVTLQKTGGLEENTVYDDEGYMVRYEVNGNTIYTLEVDNAARKRFRTDHNGNKTTYIYDERDNLIERTHPDGTSVVMRYNSFSLPIRIVDERGVVTLGEYDASGNLTRLTEGKGTPAERVTEYEYDEYGQITLTRGVGDANTSTTEISYTYDNFGNRLTETGRKGGLSTFTYDVMGNVTTRTDRRDKLWTFAYDDAGEPLTETDPLNHSVTYEYDRVGNPALLVDPSNFETRYSYDARDNLRQVENHARDTLQLEFNDNNFLTEVRDESGKTMSYEYDLSGRPVQFTDGAANSTNYSYQNKAIPENGGFFQENRIAYPSFEQVLQFDRRERPIQDTRLLDGSESLVSSLQFDAIGLVQRQTDQNNNSTSYTYDSLRRVIGIEDETNSSVSISYDDRDNLIGFTNQLGKTWRFEYDDNDRVTAEILPIGQRFVYSYDAEDNLIIKTDANGQYIEYDYDDANRAVAIRYFPSATATEPERIEQFGYDERNLLTTWSDGRHSGIRQYDEMQRLTGETINYGTFSLTYSYQYNANGTVDTFTDADDTEYRYIYDGANKPTGVIIPGTGTVVVNEYDWLAPKTITLPGGATREVSRTSLLEPASIVSKDPGGNVVAEIATTRDAARNIVSRTSDIETNTYTYDAIYRLTGVTSEQREDWSFTYDDTGNRLTLNSAPEDWVYDDNNRLLEAGSLTFGYDENGNRVSREESGNITQYLYDSTNRLVRVEGAGGITIAEYAYDPFGRRLWKETASGRTYFFYSDRGLIGEYDSSGAQEKAYGYMPGVVWMTDPVYLKEGSDYHFYHNDHLGSPYKLTNVAGDVTWEANIQPFGGAEILTNTVENNLRFPGQYYDAETGLHYNFYRMYDPSTGRYLESDPIGLLGGINTYVYVGSNPLRFMDPYGLEAMDWLWGAIYKGTGGWSPEPSTTDFVAGFGDSLSFGATRGIRDAFDIGSVDICSSAYQKGEWAEIGVEVALTGGSAALRHLAARKGRTRMRNEFRRRQGHRTRPADHQLHHVNPLKGHPGGSQTLFPLGGLPPWIHSSWWNLKMLSNPAHTAAHRRLRKLEDIVKQIVNPKVTGLRAIRNVVDDCGCN